MDKNTLDSKNKTKSNVGKVIADQLSGIFLPIINYLTAASILKSILILLAGLGLMNTESGVYLIFYAVSDGFFYFLPFYLAITAAKKWNLDMFIALMIPGAMLYPDLVNLLENNTSLDFWNIPIISATYHSSVFPVLLAVGLLYFVEKPCDKFIPQAVRGFIKPIICTLVVLPITFLLFGPLGTWIGNGLTTVFVSLYKINPLIAGAFMGTAIQPMVAVGAHWSIVPICLENISTLGYDMILPLIGGAVYGQCGACIALGIIYKEKDKKSAAFQGALSAALGVTEPALYGVTLKEPRAMLSACAAGGIGGIIAAYAGTQCVSFAFPSVFTCVAYYGPGFIGFLVSMFLGLPIGFILTYIQKKQIEKRK